MTVIFFFDVRQFKQKPHAQTLYFDHLPYIVERADSLQVGWWISNTNIGVTLATTCDQTDCHMTVLHLSTPKNTNITTYFKSLHFWFMI